MYMKQKYKRKYTSLSLWEYTQQRIQLKQQLGKASTAELYQVTISHFLKFVGNPRFCIRDLSRTLVADFVTYLQNRKLATNSINTYLSNLRAIYNAACQDELLCSSQYPFKNLKLRRAVTAKRSIPIAAIQKMATFRVGSFKEELALDLCLFSFLACGMPFVDMAYLTTRNIHNNELVYHRHKTGTLIRLEITTGMWQLIHKYAPTDRKRIYLFPILPTEPPNYKQYKGCLASHNRCLKEIGNKLHLSQKFTSYVLRHSWASVALQHDIPVAVISQALGHTSEKTTRCYLSELDISELVRANQKVSGVIDCLLAKKWKSSKPYL